MKFHKVVFACAVTVAASTFSIHAAGSSASELRTALATVRAPELPREVARLIENTKGKDREERCLDIVRSAVDLNHSAAPAIVGAASRVAPELAPKFAAVATEIEPALAAGIARAAAASAPKYAGEIAAAVTQIRPTYYAQIAYEVGHAVPGKDTQIINAVVAGLPNLKPFTAAQSGTADDTKITDLVAAAPEIDTAARKLGMKTDEFLVAELTPVQVTTINATLNSPSASANARKPTVTPAAANVGVPFVPGGGKPGEANRAQTVVVTPGQGRTYYAPNPRPPYQ